MQTAERCHKKWTLTGGACTKTPCIGRGRRRGPGTPPPPCRQAGSPSPSRKGEGLSLHQSKRPLPGSDQEGVVALRAVTVTADDAPGQRAKSDASFDFAVLLSWLCRMPGVPRQQAEREDGLCLLQGEEVIGEHERRGAGRGKGHLNRRFGVLEPPESLVPKDQQCQQAEEDVQNDESYEEGGVRKRSVKTSCWSETEERGQQAVMEVAGRPGRQRGPRAGRPGV